MIRPSRMAILVCIVLVCVTTILRMFASPVVSQQNVPVPIRSCKQSPNLQFLSYNRNNTEPDKLEYIKEMMSHAWTGYTKYAWGDDELLPFSQSSKKWYGNFSLLSTPVDALDTLYIMGMFDEYKKAKELVLNNLQPNEITEPVSVFETTIRILGGLLAAYELDGDIRLVEKAVQLADALLPAFETKSGIPNNWVSLATGEFKPEDVYDSNPAGALAEAGSLQLEFLYLSDITGNPIYAEKAMFAMDQILSIKKPIEGLYPKWIFFEKLRFREGEYSLEGGCDSFYEYLLKLWLSTGDQKYWDAYYVAADALQHYLAQESSDSKLLMFPNAQNSDPSWYHVDNFHHLTCFAGGMFATGALSKRVGNWTSHLILAGRVTETCYLSYNSTKTGLGPEEIKRDGSPYTPEYRLRPETIESIFYMWRYTHDPKYREWGWQIAQNINKWCRLPTGFSGILNVNEFRRGFNSNTGEPEWPSGIKSWSEFDRYVIDPQLTIYPNSSDEFPLTHAIWRLDLQDSFFLAETLKYLYLLFASDDVIKLEEFVFNTEAHALSMRGYGKRRNKCVNFKKKKTGVLREYTSEEQRKRRRILEKWKNSIF